MNSITLSEKDIERFVRKVKRGDPNECWEWQAYKTSNGQGQFGLGKKVVLSSRVAWTLAKGTIPDNLLVCHTCDNSKCCNPNHLFLGTHKDNSIDMSKKERSGSTKLTKDDVLKIKRLLQTSMPQRQIAIRFGVTAQNIYRIKHMKSWKWISEE